MFTFWRFTIALISILASFVVFVFLVKISVYDVKFTDNLPSKGIQDIPPSDTIIPNIFAQIPPSSQTLPSQFNNSFNIQVSPQQCFEYAKNCRDVQCAFKDFNVVCNNDKNGLTCTCGTSQTSGASSIRLNAHFVFTIFISFVIFTMGFWS